MLGIFYSLGRYVAEDMLSVMCWFEPKRRIPAVVVAVIAVFPLHLSREQPWIPNLLV